MNELEVCGLQVKNKNVLFINDIQFTIEKQSFAAVVGNNGSGKSTFLSALFDFFYRQHKSVSVLRQTYSLTFDLTVKEYISLAFDAPLGEKKISVKEISFWLEKLHIEDLKDKSIHSISGGEFQLVRLAQLFLLDTEIIILDEPDLNLDHKNKVLLFNVLDELSQSKLIFCSTHNLNYLLQLRGKILFFSASKCCYSPLNEECLSKTINSLSI